VATTPGDPEKAAAEQLELAIVKHLDAYLPRVKPWSRYAFVFGLPRLEDLDATHPKLLSTADETARIGLATAWTPLHFGVERAQDRAEGYTVRMEIGLRV
jgi:hypothetical protein